MTDRETIDLLATKIMGWTLCGDCWMGAGEPWARPCMAFAVDGYSAPAFNPLANDGDACMVLDRLAVLYTNVTLHHADGWRLTCWSSYGGGDGPDGEQWDVGQPCGPVVALTMRGAIVATALAVAEALKHKEPS